jgi:S-methylmethionine-dependent homocysteine/selenocysteine methylase
MITNEGMSSYEAIDVLRSSVRLARTAVETAVTDQHIYVVASIGPYATTFADASEYSGHYVDMIAESVSYSDGNNYTSSYLGND